MLPELRVLIERARARRMSLEGLLDALPPDYWDRVAAGEGWSIRRQVIHLSGADRMVSELLEEVAGGARRVWVGGTRDAGELSRRRHQPLAELAGRPQAELRAIAASARTQLIERMARLGPERLEAAVHVAGAVDRWGEPLEWSLCEYLAAWTGHDPEHEASIRRAMTTPPDLSTVALTRGRMG